MNWLREWEGEVINKSRVCTDFRV